MRKPGLYMFFAKTDDPMQTHTVYVEVLPSNTKEDWLTNPDSFRLNTYQSGDIIDAWIEHYAWIYDSYTFLNWWIVNEKGD